MIIDCHGHYTTAPKALEAWRNQQIAGIKDPSQKPRVSDLKISDDEIRETIVNNQLRLMKERGNDLTLFSPACQLHGPPHRRLRSLQHLGRDLQRAVLPRRRSCSPSTSCRWRCCRSRPVSIRGPASPNW